MCTNKSWLIWSIFYLWITITWIQFSGFFSRWVFCKYFSKYLTSLKICLNPKVKWVIVFIKYKKWYIKFVVSNEYLLMISFVQITVFKYINLPLQNLIGNITVSWYRNILYNGVVNCMKCYCCIETEFLNLRHVSKCINMPKISASICRKSLDLITTSSLADTFVPIKPLFYFFRY